MKRFLIFALVFPGIALAVFFILLSMAMGMLPDNPQAIYVVAWGYVVGVVPALICAGVDLLLRRTRIPPLVGTTLVGYGIALIAAVVIFDWGLFGKMLAFGLIGGIPAAVCSWLSNEKQKTSAAA